MERLEYIYRRVIRKKVAGKPDKDTHVSDRSLLALHFTHGVQDLVDTRTLLRIFPQH